ncbi:MAG: hypothetical protein ACOC32_02380 [Nanoarchaeota archaeon]
MGHYYAEMFPRGEVSSEQLYKKRRKRERDMNEQLEDIVKNNPITIDGVTEGSKLVLFPELFEHKILHADHYGDYTVADYVRDYKINTWPRREFSPFSRAHPNQLYTIYQIGDDRHPYVGCSQQVLLSPRPEEKKGRIVIIHLSSAERWAPIRYFSKAPAEVLEKKQ